MTSGPYLKHIDQRIASPEVSGHANGVFILMTSIMGGTIRTNQKR